MIVRSFLPSLSSSCSSNFTRGATISSITTVYIFRTLRTICPPLYERTSGGYSSFSPVCRLPRFASRKEQTYRSSALVPLTVRSFVRSLVRSRVASPRFVTVSTVPYRTLLSSLPSLSLPRHCQFSPTRVRIVTKHGPERDKQLCRKRESVRETHERDERSVVCVRKHVATRVRRSKAHTRETQFKPKERESGGDVTEVLRLSYYTLGGPG